MKIRIPTDYEIKAILKIGGLRLVLAIPQLGIYGWKQLSKLSLHCASGIERLYHESFLKPLDVLMYGENSNIIEAEVVGELGGIELFDFTRFKSEPDSFPHIRIIAKSGLGKTTLARYILSLLGGNQYVITAKKKPKDWAGLAVYGTPFNYGECKEWLDRTIALMYGNYKLIEQNLTPEFTNIAVDEWRSIQKNVDSAKDSMKELISVARDARVRILAIATGEQVSTWGLEGESDLEECFTTIRLGEFAIEYAKRIKVSKEVLTWLQRQKRPCMVDRYPAEIPDLSNWQPPANQFQLSSGSVTPPPSGQFLKTPETMEETTENQGFQPSKTDFPETIRGAEIELLSEILAAFRENRSDDWVAKNVIMHSQHIGYQKARAKAEELRGMWR
jgi:hypothetical protein